MHIEHHDNQREGYAYRPPSAHALVDVRENNKQEEIKNADQQDKWEKDIPDSSGVNEGSTNEMLMTDDCQFTRHG